MLGQRDGKPGKVERVDVVGEDAYAYVRVAGLTVAARVPAAARPSPGDEVLVTVQWHDTHVFEAGSGRRLDRP